MCVRHEPKLAFSWLGVGYGWLSRGFPLGCPWLLLMPEAADSVQAVGFAWRGGVLFRESGSVVDGADRNETHSGS